jgi:hypothetical protein
MSAGLTPQRVIHSPAGKTGLGEIEADYPSTTIGRVQPEVRIDFFGASENDLLVCDYEEVRARVPGQNPTRACERTASLRG